MMAGLGVIAFDFFFTAFPQSAETLTARVFRNGRSRLGLRFSEQSHHRFSDRHAEGSSRNAVSPAPLNVGEQISAGTSPGANVDTSPGGHAEGGSRNAVSPAPVNVGEQVSAAPSPGANLETDEGSSTLREAVAVDQIIPLPSMLSGLSPFLESSSVLAPVQNQGNAARRQNEAVSSRSPLTAQIASKLASEANVEMEEGSSTLREALVAEPGVRGPPPDVGQPAMGLSQLLKPSTYVSRNTSTRKMKNIMDSGRSARQEEPPIRFEYDSNQAYQLAKTAFERREGHATRS
jgi:hypothetical protein